MRSYTMFSKYARGLFRRGKRMIQGLTVKQAAKYLDMGKPTVYKRIPEDRIPFHKALTGYLFDAAELVEWTGVRLRDTQRATFQARPVFKESKQ